MNYSLTVNYDVENDLSHAHSGFDKDVAKFSDEEKKRQKQRTKARRAKQALQRINYSK